MMPVRLLLLVISLSIATQFLHAQSTLIPLSTRRDMVFDHSGTYLYISTSDGFVGRYNIAAGQFDASYNLGGSLNGIDIAPDDSFLLVAQGVTNGSQGTFYRLNLSDGSVTNINYTLAQYEGGGWDVKIASNSLALATTESPGDDAVPLHQIDLASNTITTRGDTPGAFGGRTEANTVIVRSADYTLLYFQDTGEAAQVYLYDAHTNSFSASAEISIFLGNAGAAVSRSGTMVATLCYSYIAWLSNPQNYVALDSAPGLNYLRSFGKLDGGIAFDPIRDQLYGVSSATSEIIAYNTTTYAELFRMSIGESIPAGANKYDTGSLIASGDGRFLALETATGVRIFTLPATPYPPPAAPTFGTPHDMVFDKAGGHLYITTLEGLVWPYNISAKSFEAPFDLGGALYGIDISPDDGYLLVAQWDIGLAQSTVQKVDLLNRTITSWTVSHSLSIGGAWDLAIGSTGLAMLTIDGQGGVGPWVDFYQIDLSNGAISKRADEPKTEGSPWLETQVCRSADGTHMYYAGGFTTFTYNALTNAFGPSVTDHVFGYGSARIAMNRDGSLVATRHGGIVSMNTAPALNPLHTFGAFNGAIAFDAVTDTIYGTSSYMSQIIAYDTNTYAEKFRFDIGETVFAGAFGQFSKPSLVASSDGKHLAYHGVGTVYVYDVPAVQLVSCSSAKAQAGATFEIDLPLDGPIAVEGRSGGANKNYTMVFAFGQSLASVGAASVTAGSGTIASSYIDSNDSQRYIVNLTGVTNAQTIKVTLSGVVDVAGNHTALISQQMGILLGDVNGDGAVNSADSTQVRNYSGQQVTPANFRADLNGDGVINSADATIVRNSSGTGLSTPRVIKEIGAPTRLED